MKIFLTGFRGSGKSTVGRELARRMDLKFVDTDEEIERHAGRKISDIFARDGEGRFRELEKEEVLGACRLEDSVVALGGGALTNPEVALAVKQCGIVVLLKASSETLYKRICSDDSTGTLRPDLTEHGGLEEVRELLSRRKDSYADAAELEIDTEWQDPAGIAEAIEAEIKKRGYV